MTVLSEGQFRQGEIELKYRRGGNGPPLLFLHGFPLDGQMWQAQVESLTDAYDVIVPDLRGFGRSSLSEDDVEQGVAMHRYAADAIALLTALEINEAAAVAGFSMGGYAAWQFALHHAARLKNLILLDTRAAADAPEARARRLEMAEEVLAEGDVESALAMMPKLLASASLEGRPELVEQLEAMIRRQSPQAIAAAQRGMAARHDVSGRLSEITHRTLLLGGEHDAISPPEEMQGIADQMPNGRFVAIPDAGHMSPMENSEAVNNAIREFLADY